MCAFNIVVPTHRWHETHFTMQRWKVTGCVQRRSEEACPQPSFMLGDLWHGAAIAVASTTLVNFTNLRCSFMTLLQREGSISDIKIFCSPSFPLHLTFLFQFRGILHFHFTFYCSIQDICGHYVLKLKPTRWSLNVEKWQKGRSLSKIFLHQDVGRKVWQHKATIFTADSRDPLERDKIMGAFLLLLPCPYLGGGSNIKTEQTCVSWSCRVFALVPQID